MIAAFDNHLGEDCWILPFQPDWQAGVETRFTLHTGHERSLSGRESRRAYAGALRLELTYEALLSARQAASLRNALQDPQFESRPVWFPFWPGEREQASGPLSGFHAAQTMRWSSSENVVLLTDPAGEYGPFAPWTRWIPALRGYFAEAPQVEALTDELFVARMRLREDGPASLALQLIGQAFANGPQVSGRDHMLFPLRPQWRSNVRTGGAAIEFDRRDIGFGREEARAIHPQSPERSLRFDLSVSGNASGAGLIRFFAHAQATAASFWCPTWMAEARLEADAAPGATTLAVTDGDRIGSNAYVALVNRDGSTEVRAVSSKSAQTITLSEPLQSAHPMDSTSVVTAALVRFVRPALTLRWRGTAEVSATVDLTEVATDYHTPSGEAHGDTIGTLRRFAFLYRFTAHYPGSPRVWRFTSNEQSLQHEGGEFEPRPFEHGEIRETLNLERNEIQVRARAFDGNPLLLFVPFRLEFPLKLEVIEAEVLPGNAVAQNPVRIFSGEVTRVRLDGPYITASATQAGNLFERRIPRVLMQPTCNYALFDGACGLLQDDWKYRGHVLATLVNPTRVQLRSLERVTGTWIQPSAHWFAGGWVELGGAADFESRFIADATAYSTSGDGFVELTLSTPLGRVPAVDEEVFLFPGCDGKRGTCKDKFSNYARFGGFPHMPVGNPSMVKMPANRNMK